LVKLLFTCDTGAAEKLQQPGVEFRRLLKLRNVAALLDDEEM
jgi:hypothetical protein